ncbi:MAG TPA: CPBP family intramembrane metalloprotease [Planctomycetaceae bacterium]|nr:CPBP family intramembrane metalloprotease [Planctomycetaceae bacterium]
MKWSNVRWILAREVRDQLRDRRTLFMITVLPLLLYPLLGTVFFQIVQFQRRQTTRVLVVGAASLQEVEGIPELFSGRRFAPRWFSMPARAEQLEVRFWEPGGRRLDMRAEARRAVLAGRCDVAVCFAPDFAQRLGRFRRQIKADWEVPSPDIFYSTASEKSQVGFVRVHEVLQRWKDEIGRKNLEAAGLPPKVASPFELATADVAESTGRRGAAFWSKILPVLLLVWAMTGAFYPAVDLCAGEKERGTLETLLASPAERSEIVLGKLATIMLFSMVTAVLNLASMGVTGWLLLGRMDPFGAPPPLAALWLAIASVPVSGLFSALCLALAAFARSTKEGQYYLVPLLLVTMPLVILPMAPGVEVTLGNSLIPVTGVVLILRALLEGNYLEALRFLAPVVVVTLVCCTLAVRWAIEQFNSETVLFRGGERLDVALWVRHLLADRRPTPTVAAAVSCGVVILVLKFFVSFAIPAPGSSEQFAVLCGVTQLAVIAAPVLLMTAMLTTSPRQTLLLRSSGLRGLVAAVALAFFLQPAVHGVRGAVMRLYPLSEEIERSLQAMVGQLPLWQIVLLVALMPAVCEELAFRGFILSGLRHLGHKWRAIIYSALFFGLSHALLQQSILATLLGVLLGYVVVQTGSLWPGVALHGVHNILVVAAGMLLPGWLERWPVLGWAIVRVDQHGVVFQWPVVLLSTLLAAWVVLWFHRLPYPRSPEEARRETILRAAQVDG